MQVADGDLSLLRLAINTFDPWVIGFIGAAGLLTALVPASVMLMAASVGLTNSFYKVLVPKATGKQQLVVSRIIIIAISVVALIITIKGGEALAMLNIMSYSLITQLAPALFLSFWKNQILNKYGAITGIVVGVVIVLYSTISGANLAKFFPNVPHVLNDISIGAIAVIINFIVAIVVSTLIRIPAVSKESVYEGNIS
jgi:SSS family solute:Na+ symporter